MDTKKGFPEGMKPLGGERFTFSCHPHIRCFTTCCKNVDLILYPYDIIRLKNYLQIKSTDFLQRFTRLAKGDNPFFPTVMLRLQTSNEDQCPFLSEIGCTVYQDRPSACRMYPLERAVDRLPERHADKEYYFLVRHAYCLGHSENHTYSVREWIREQRLDEYNVMNELWTEMDTLFSRNPWQGEGAIGPKQQLAFMICYDVDAFRNVVNERKLVKQFRLSKEIRKGIAGNDVELMKFGFQWLKLYLTGRSSLVKK